MPKTLEAFCKENGIDYRSEEPMCRHTSFHIGGNAEYFLTVDSAEKLMALLPFLRERTIPYFIIGNGSNLLVSDRGIAGAVISLAPLCGIKVEGNQILCGAGAALSRLCCVARDHALSGLEFAYGIPGTVGGALTMNAGAYGGEMKDIVQSATVLEPDGTLHEITQDAMMLSYRSSVFQKSGGTIVSAVFSFKKAEKAEIAQKMNDFLAKRKEKQPLEYPSAGSTFKRPAGHFAGALIEKNHCKGLRVGGASVSEKHAGFVVNTGGATCADVLAVMEKVRQTVLAADGVLLEPEVLFVGRSMK